MNNDKASISEQWIKGSKEAVSIVFKENYKRLFFEAFRILRDEQSAEDMIQELFVRILSNKLYREIRLEGVKGYLLISIRHDCLYKLRKEERSQRHMEGYTDFKSQYSEPITTVIEQKELKDQLDQALRELHPQPRVAFSLAYMENKSYLEASALMKISKNTFKSHLKIAIKELREKLIKIR